MCHQWRHSARPSGAKMQCEWREKGESLLVRLPDFYCRVAIVIWVRNQTRYRLNRACLNQVSQTHKVQTLHHRSRALQGQPCSARPYIKQDHSVSLHGPIYNNFAIHSPFSFLSQSAPYILAVQELAVSSSYAGFSHLHEGTHNARLYHRVQNN